MEGVGISKVKTGVVMVGVGGTLTISGSSTIDFKGDGVGVGVLGGVTRVSLMRTVITGDGNEKSTGVYAMGTGEMAVRLDNVRISNVAKGVSVEGKGSLTIRDGSVDFTGAHGVYVGKKVTSANLNDLTIKGKESGMGVYAMGGTVTMNEVKVEGVEMGVMMVGKEGKSLTIRGNSTIDFKGDGVGVGVVGRGEEC